MFLGIIKGCGGFCKGSSCGCGKGCEGRIDMDEATQHGEEVQKKGRKGINRVSEDYGPHVVVETSGPEEGSTNNGNDLGHIYLCGSEGVLVFWLVGIGEQLIIGVYGGGVPWPSIHECFGEKGGFSSPPFLEQDTQISMIK